MAQLSSPGVSVTVIDESFYTPAAPGTVPLVIVASEENKKNSAGLGTAPGTLKANAGKVYLLTSQADLGSTFGIPYFQTDASNNPVNAGELNEYGLQAAYSFLGVSSRAYVVRADLDTKQLIGTANIPHGEPADGTLWFDTIDSAYGVFEWNNASASTAGGQTFTNKPVKVLTTGNPAIGDTGAPRMSFGSLGDYALVVDGSASVLYLKKYNTASTGSNNAGDWVEVGGEDWAASWPAVSSTVINPPISNAGDITMNAYVSSDHKVHVSSVTGGSLVTDGTQTFTDGTRSFLLGLGVADQVGVLTTATTCTVNAGGNPKGSAATYTGVVAKSVTPAGGSLATFNVTVGATGGSIYTPSNTTITVNAFGKNYSVGDGFVIDGALLGGVSITNDLAFTISGSIASTYNVSLETGGSLPFGTALNPVAFVFASAASDIFKINGVTIAGVQNIDGLAGAINTDLASQGISASVQQGKLNIYSTGASVELQAVAGHANHQWSKIGFTVGSYPATKLTLSPHYKLPAYKKTSLVTGAPTGSVWVKTTAVNLGANWFLKRYNATTETFIQQSVQLLPNGESALAALDPKGGGINLPLTSLYVQYNKTRNTMPMADFTILKRAKTGPTVANSVVVTSSTLPSNTYTFTIQESQIGKSTLSTAVPVTFVSNGATADAAAFVEILNASLVNSKVSASLNANNSISLTHATGGDIYLLDTNGDHAISNLFGDQTHVHDDPAHPMLGYIVSYWEAASVTASAQSPRDIPADQTLWYNTVIDEVDIMIHDGEGWKGYLNYAETRLTNPTGPYIGASKPVAPWGDQPPAAFVTGDLWIDTSDLEHFPIIHRYNADLAKWIVVDNTDHTTDQGVIFHDARWSTAGNLSAPATIKDLLSSDFLDADAPDPALYPTGMLLWNLRRSGFNVKKYVHNYVDTTANNPRMAGGTESQGSYYPNAWVSNAANDVHGVGQFGRKAQRAVVLQALQATIQGNQGIRDTDSKQFNLISCPGYLETLSSLIALNTDRGESAFIVSDAPARLTPDATSLNNWGNNVAGAEIDGDKGLIATNAYAAVYYPWGYTQDLLGNNICVPPSHIMLRTFALSDNVSYPWFAPAGVRRGGVTNAASVGYVNSIGEFVTVALNQGQRDTLAGIHVNPITYLAGTGLVCYGQYTRQLIASSLDRINVARLVIYLRHQLNMLAKPFIFEPNDTITRNEIKQQVEKLLLELTGQRALYDYLVVCDTSNNTPARIDRSELHVDIAIEPVKAVEFIYIPMRLENTGAIKGLSK